MKQEDAGKTAGGRKSGRGRKKNQKASVATENSLRRVRAEAEALANLEAKSAYGAGAYARKAFSDLQEALCSLELEFADAEDLDLSVPVESVCPEAVVAGCDGRSPVIVSAFSGRDGYDAVPRFIGAYFVLPKKKGRGAGNPAGRANRLNNDRIVCGRVVASEGDLVYGVAIPLPRPGGVTVNDARMVLDLFRRELSEILLGF